MDPSRGVIRLRANTAESWYNSLQTGLEKRFSDGLSAGLHYTWSQFLDTASEIFNPSSGEVAVPQDSFDIDGEKGRSSYDRPHRFTGNFVWELPLHARQQGVARQDPRRLAVRLVLHLPERRAVHAAERLRSDRRARRHRRLVGNAIRPMLNTDQDLVGHDDPGADRRRAAPACSGRCAAFPSATCAGERVGNAPRNRCAPTASATSTSALTKNTRFANGQNIQLRIEMFNATNTRNFGIPDGRVNSANFLNQWATDGGNRRSGSPCATCSDRPRTRPGFLAGCASYFYLFTSDFSTRATARASTSLETSAIAS